jgi:hypothetical protein
LPQPPACLSVSFVRGGGGGSLERRPRARRDEIAKYSMRFNAKRSQLVSRREKPHCVSEL